MALTFLCARVRRSLAWNFRLRAPTPVLGCVVCDRWRTVYGAAGPFLWVVWTGGLNARQWLSRALTLVGAGGCDGTAFLAVCVCMSTWESVDDLIACLTAKDSAADEAHKLLIAEVMRLRTENLRLGDESATWRASYVRSETENHRFRIAAADSERCVVHGCKLYKSDADKRCWSCDERDRMQAQLDASRPARDTYLRVTGLGNENLRKFGPTAADHPSVGHICPACRRAFAAGDFTTLVTLGPGDDPEAQARAVAGRPYNAVAAELHWSCVTGEP